MNSVKLMQNGNCYYLIQNLAGLSLYQRTKTIDKFIKHETKILENCIDNEIRAIFKRNGINVYETDKSALNDLFSALNEKGKDIELVDLYDTPHLDNCVLLGKSPNGMTIWLEDDTLLQCGFEVKEIENG